MLVLKKRTIVNIYYEHRDDGSIVKITESLVFDFSKKFYKMRSFKIKTIYYGGEKNDQKEI